jgi:hypothetical protein
MIQHHYHVSRFQTTGSRLVSVYILSIHNSILKPTLYQIHSVSMGLISRVEPPGLELIESYSECIPLLQKVGWLEFLMSFHGHNLGVARDFSHNFNGWVTRIGDIEMQVDEAMIAEATHLPLKGELWSKNMQAKDIPWS